MLSRFYGFTPDLIDEMDSWEFNQYLKSMEFIEAREKLDLIKISIFDKLKKEHQREFEKSFMSKLNRGEKKIVDFAELKRMLTNG